MESRDRIADEPASNEEDFVRRTVAHYVEQREAVERTIADLEQRLGPELRASEQRYREAFEAYQKAGGRLREQARRYVDALSAVDRAESQAQMVAERPADLNLVLNAWFGGFGSQARVRDAKEEVMREEADPLDPLVQAQEDAWVAFLDARHALFEAAKQGPNSQAKSANLARLAEARERRKSALLAEDAIKKAAQ